MAKFSLRFNLGLVLVLLLTTFLAGCGDSTATSAGVTNTPPTVNASTIGANTIAPATTQAVPGPTTTTTVNKGGTLRVAFNTEVATLDPLSGNGPSAQVFNSLYDSLVSTDTNLKIIPSLARSWEISADGKTYTFKLQPDVKFQDGSEFNAEAVKFNIERYKASPDSIRKNIVKSIESVEVVDNLTAKFNLATPDASLLANMVLSIWMVSPMAVQKLGAELARNPVGAGTGPFKFVEWKKDERLVVERNPNYWRKDAAGNQLPYLDKIIYRPIPDEITMLTNFKTGNVEAVNIIPTQYIDELVKLTDLKVMSVPSAAFTSFWFNVTTPPFNNKALRQAVAYAIDREAILRNVYFGRGSIIEGPLGPSSWAFDPGFKPYSYSPAKARAKLVEGGKPDGFSFKVIINTATSSIQVALVIRDQLAEVGINMEIEQQEEASRNEAFLKKNYTAQLFLFGGQIDPDGNMYRFFRSDNSNPLGYSNPQVDALLDKGRVSSDLKTRIAVYQEAQQIISDDAPVVIFYNEPVYQLANKKVQNYTISADRMMRFAEVWLS